jgi:ABC-type multidrug transport system permease subunit
MVAEVSRVGPTAEADPIAESVHVSSEDDPPRPIDSRRLPLLSRKPNSDSPRARSTRRFLLHYLEMVAAMFLGMIVLGIPAGWLFSAFGTSWSELSTSWMLFAMAITMSVPMAGWMRYRGHEWQPTLEMVAAMLLPTVALMALGWAQIVSGMGAAMAIEHVAMLAAMLAAMLVRLDEYAGAHHGHGAPQPVIAAA